MVHGSIACSPLLFSCLSSFSTSSLSSSSLLSLLHLPLLLSLLFSLSYSYFLPLASSLSSSLSSFPPFILQDGCPRVPTTHHRAGVPVLLGPSSSLSPSISLPHGLIPRPCTLPISELDQAGVYGHQSRPTPLLRRLRGRWLSLGPHLSGWR